MTTYTYDANGNREYITLPGNRITGYYYDSMNRLTDLYNYVSTPQYNNGQPDDLTSSYSNYNYDILSNGMRDGVAESVLQSNDTDFGNVQKSYIYDELNRLETEKRWEDNTKNGIWDAAENGYEITYSYDLAGNREERLVMATQDGAHPIRHTTYSYDPANDRLEHEITTNTIQVVAIEHGSDYPLYAMASKEGITWQASNGISLSGFKAFINGLPSKWNMTCYVFAILAIPALFASSLLLRRRNISRFNRGMSIVLIWLLILGPTALPLLAEFALDYSVMLDRWGVSNTRIEYLYNDNGSLTSKTTYPCDNGGVISGAATDTIIYTYNLQGRLDSVSTSSGSSTDVVFYYYDSVGNRVAKAFDDNGDNNVESLEYYLVDPSNHTGYSQVLEEWYDSDAHGANAAVLVKTYTIGDDIIAQTDSGNNTNYLLYDGHGSTRQLLDGDNITAVYDYDAYGVDIQNDVSEANSNLQYSGEMKDAETDDYYLRARYYSPSNGRFNRVDPYSGNMQDPQSLHKYLYCHANPVNGIDPSGEFFALLKPAFRRLIKAVGVDLALRMMIGIRATYVLGEAYMKEVNRRGVLINSQIARKNDDYEKWYDLFRLRPDIVDHYYRNIYEIKPDNTTQISLGRSQVAGYIAAMFFRYPGRLYTPGYKWKPRCNPYPLVQIPGLEIGIPITLTARNAGGGVIAYTINPNPEELIATVLIAYESANLISLAIKAKMLDYERMKGHIAIAGMLGAIGGFAL